MRATGGRSSRTTGSRERSPVTHTPHRVAHRAVLSLGLGRGIIRTLRSGAAFASSVVLTACTSTVAVVRQRAAADFACDTGDVRIARLKQHAIVEEVGPKVPLSYRAEGCDKADVYVEVCPPGRRSGSSQCTFESASRLQRDALQRRASFDLASGDLEQVPLDGRATGVSGCGKRATYLWTCPHDPTFYSSACAWVLNTDSSRDPRSQ